jgi:hypothetical protein
MLRAGVAFSQQKDEKPSRRVDLIGIFSYAMSSWCINRKSIVQKAYTFKKLLSPRALKKKKRTRVSSVPPLDPRTHQFIYY